MAEVDLRFDRVFVAVVTAPCAMILSGFALVFGGFASVTLSDSCGAPEWLAMGVFWLLLLAVHAAPLFVLRSMARANSPYRPLFRMVCVLGVVGYVAFWVWFSVFLVPYLASV